MRAGEIARRVLTTVVVHDLVAVILDEARR
jgi:hypothetical protein